MIDDDPEYIRGGCDISDLTSSMYAGDTRGLPNDDISESNYSPSVQSRQEVENPYRNARVSLIQVFKFSFIIDCIFINF